MATLFALVLTSLLRLDPGHAAADARALAIAERLEEVATTPTVPRCAAEISSALEAYGDVARNPDARALLEPSPDAMSVTHNLRVMRTMPPEILQTARRVSGGMRVSAEDISRRPQDYLVLYHGTTRSVASSVARRVLFRAGNGEFGSGFYLTSSRTQAGDWAATAAATRRAGEEPIVLIYVFRRAALERVIAAQTQLALAKATPLFERLVQLNRAYRASSLPPEANPSNRIATIYGPSISASKGVFNQLKFSPSRANAALFDADQPDLAVYLDQ